MNHSKGVSLSELLVILLFVGILSIVPYALNAYQLSKCDFKAPYRCEIIHGIGLIPALAIVTVWFATDK